MKKVLLLSLLAGSLLACAGLAVLDRYNCGQGICTTLQVVEPVRRDEPVTVVITVTADRDLPDLSISLTHDYGIEVEDPPASEKATITFRDKSGLGWAAPVKANQPASFSRKIRLPSRDGIFQIVASAGTPKTGRAATDSINIYLTPTGGTVYGSGTRIPTPLTPIRAVTMTPTPMRTPTRPPYP